MAIFSIGEEKHIQEMNFHEKKINFNKKVQSVTFPGVTPLPAPIVGTKYFLYWILSCFPVWNYSREIYNLNCFRIFIFRRSTDERLEQQIEANLLLMYLGVNALGVLVIQK